MKKLLFLLLITNYSLLIVNAQWVQVNNGLGNATVRPLASSGNNIFAGTDLNGVYLSANNGTNWTQTSLNNQSVQSFAFNGNNVFAGTLNNGVYLSTNNGTNWTQTSLNNRTVRSLIVNGNNIFAGTTSSYGVYLSTNNGTTWTQTSLNNQNIYSFAVNGNNIFAGTALSYGVYLSTDNGTTWTQTSLNNCGDVFSLAVNGNNIFAGTYLGTGVYVSNDNGTSWTQRNEGLGEPPADVRSLCILNNYIFAAALSNGVYRRPLGELIGIQIISNEVPSKFSLSQNYPNPFNPTTVIRYSLIVNSFVSLKVYDVLGNEVTTLVNENLKPGTYEVSWNASNYPSGVYYYRLIADEYTETRKMVLIK